MRTMMIGLAAIALIITSCSTNETFDNNVPDKAIEFTNLNGRIPSKAANDSTSDYSVYAVLNNGNPAATDWFMNDIQINGTTNNYSPMKFWPKAGTINFFAYAPYGSPNLDLSNVIWATPSPSFEISYTIPANADEDLTIATPVNGLSTGPVQLNFSHMLSRVTFLTTLDAALANDGFVLTLDSVDLALSYETGNNSLSAPAAWTNLSASAPTVHSGKNTYMIMPQPADGTAIALNVTVTHNGANYYSGKLQSYTINGLAGLTNFEPGKNYQFEITVGNDSEDNIGNKVFNVILFNTDITPWDSENIPIIQP